MLGVTVPVNRIGIPGMLRAPAKLAFCQLTGTIAPVTDGAQPIGFQVNLPTAWSRAETRAGQGVPFKRATSSQRSRRVMKWARVTRACVDRVVLFNVWVATRMWCSAWRLAHRRAPVVSISSARCGSSSAWSGSSAV
jgi:hypothetical protein